MSYQLKGEHLEPQGNDRTQVERFERRYKHITAHNTIRTLNVGADHLGTHHMSHHQRKRRQEQV
ncbi:uncharacterized protein LAESUDRAFT_221811 [Laetiporus sulphureus 93-53]|uniref:Uncharacterized protein n=1 Tax=Laetiporus sulphureus 93-53 TaxID=1314785 RepID=A0A165DTC5_9APHY|nr:uncharacterized protein LAESUDRAFT_221811 [Laetiporus sulphureus 93-53]KZT05590.1 hypothetical protein LAESUDRAFT_221811 [Laetiporus sulphureus 93-53]